MLAMISIGYWVLIEIQNKKIYMPAMLKLSICVFLSGAGDRIGQSRVEERKLDGRTVEMAEQSMEAKLLK